MQCMQQYCKENPEKPKTRVSTSDQAILERWSNQLSYDTTQIGQKVNFVDSQFPVKEMNRVMYLICMGKYCEHKKSL